MNPQSNAATAATWQAMLTECEAAGAVKERARISAIMNCPEAIFRVSDALLVALDSNMTLPQARAALAADQGRHTATIDLRVSAAARVADIVAPRQALAI